MDIWKSLTIWTSALSLEADKLRSSFVYDSSFLRVFFSLSELSDNRCKFPSKSFIKSFADDADDSALILESVSLLSCTYITMKCATIHVHL